MGPTKPRARSVDVESAAELAASPDARRALTPGRLQHRKSYKAAALDTRPASRPSRAGEVCAGCAVALVVVFLYAHLGDDAGAGPPRGRSAAVDHRTVKKEPPLVVDPRALARAFHATPAGTARFAARHAHDTPGLFRFAAGNLTVSGVGVGTYLGDADDETDARVAAAIVESVQAGVNVVDTAANYRRGRGEVAVGRALRDVFATGLASRDEILVSTKAGFLTTPDLLRRALDYGARDADFDASRRHCVAAPCLRASLDASLEKLGLEAVDVLYLHNVAEKRDDLDRAGLLDVLATAFAWLEGERRRRRIRAYGLATFAATFRAAPGEAGSLGLARDLVPLARAAAGCRADAVQCDHGLRFAQLPVGPRFPEFWAAAYDGGRTLNESARDAGVSVVASKSLGPKLRRGEDRCNAAPGASDDAGAAALHVTRSTPGLAVALVGHKARSHVDANLAVLGRPPLDEAAWRAALARDRDCQEANG